MSDMIEQVNALRQKKHGTSGERVASHDTSKRNKGALPKRVPATTVPRKVVRKCVKS